MIPMSAWLVMKSERTIRLWLPLFLLWILLLPFVLIAAVIWFMSMLGRLVLGLPGRMAGLIAAAFGILWELDGLRIHVRSPKEIFVLRFRGGKT